MSLMKLTIKNWKLMMIKFTEIETIDIIAKPLRELLMKIKIQSKKNLEVR